MKIGKQTAKNVGVTLDFDRLNRQGWNHAYETSTDDQGHFAFNRVYPGKGSVARVIAVKNGMTEARAGTNPVPVEVLPGKTIQLQIGGKGRAVVGRIDSGGRITNWTDIGQIRSKYDVLEDYYGFKVAPDGSFRIDDMAPGKYALDVRITKPMPETDLPGSTEALRDGRPSATSSSISPCLKRRRGRTTNRWTWARSRRHFLTAALKRALKRAPLPRPPRTTTRGRFPSREWPV